MYAITKTGYRKHPHLFNLAIIYCCSCIAFFYLPSFSFLIGWDDQWFVTNHYTTNGLTWKNLSAIFTEFYYGQYAPINQLHYTILYAVFGYKTAYFHLASVLLHLLNTTLVYLLIVRIATMQFGLNRAAALRISFFTALLFCVSPFNLEPVAWVAASKVLLYAFFYLLSLMAYTLYLQQRKTLWYYLTIAGFALSFGAKEQAVTLPVCLLLLDYIYGRNFKDPMVWYEKVPMLILSILFGIITLQSQGLETIDKQFYGYFDRGLLSLYTICEYFIKTILPVKVSFIYPFPFLVGQKPPIWIYLYPVLVPALIFLVYPVLRKKWIFFGLTFFCIHILLVSNLLSLARFSLIADRYAYIATIGIYFLVATVIEKQRTNLRNQRLLAISVAIYLITFICYTRQHSVVWRNTITLKEEMRSVIEKRSDYPSWKEKVK